MTRMDFAAGAWVEVEVAFLWVWAALVIAVLA